MININCTEHDKNNISAYINIVSNLSQVRTHEDENLCIEFGLHDSWIHVKAFPQLGPTAATIVIYFVLWFHSYRRINNKWKCAMQPTLMGIDNAFR